MARQSQSHKSKARHRRGRPVLTNCLPKSLSKVNLNAAGIDIGSTQHSVAVPDDRDEPTVRCFGTFTADLEVLADWLEQSGVETVARESTGVYWIPVFELLEAKGFEVKLVEPGKLKGVPGRKTDILDCQWIQQRHTYGLLSGLRSVRARLMREDFQRFWEARPGRRPMREEEGSGRGSQTPPAGPRSSSTKGARGPCVRVWSR